MSGAPDLGQAEGTVVLVAGGLALLAVWYVIRKGPAGIVQAAAGAAGQVVTGGVDAASTAVGIPTTEQTTTDPAVARWIIDNFGYFDASKWCGVPALWDASFMAEGSGTPPPAGSPIAIAHPTPTGTASAGGIDFGNPTSNPYGW